MRALSGVAILFVTCLACTRAHAADAPTPDLAEEAELHFTLGVEAYRRKDYTGALEHLLLSNRLAPNRNVVFNLARAYEQLGRPADAFRHYADYLALEEDPARRVQAEDALQRLRPNVALVRVETDPPGATLYVDRKDLGPRGAAPRVLALEPGAHVVIAESEGYDPAASPPVDLVLGKEAVVRLPMARVLGTVRVEGTEGALVHLDTEDGPVVGTVPATFEVPPGARVLVMTAPGRRAVREPVDVAPRGLARVVVDLPPETGSIVVDAGERGALIELDGASAGFTPAVLTAPVGRHRVRVSQAGFRPYESDVEVTVDGRVAIDARLLPLQEVNAASRSTQSIEDAPASVTLITAEELRALGAQTLYDALCGIRGVTCTDDLTYQSVGFRGLSALGGNNNHLLVTMDGHAMNDDQLGTAYLGHDLLPDLHDIERIEVVRGPGSALYGTNAFFGVVNLVTRSAATTRRPHVSLAADGSATVRARASASGVLGKPARDGVPTGRQPGGWWASAGAVSSQGSDYVFPELADSGTGGVSEGADALRAGGVRARAWIGDLSVQGYWNERAKQIPTGAYGTVLADPRARSTDTRGFAEVRWEPALSSRTTLYTRAFLDHYRFEGDYPYADSDVGTVQDRWTGTWTGAEARVTVQPTRALRLTGGAQADLHLQAELRGSDAQGTYLEVSQPYQVLAGYATVEGDVGKVLSASLGARVDAYSTFGATINPRVALVLRPAARHVLKVLGGRAFRAPTIYELTYNDDGASQVASPDLGPESILTGEVEYTWRASDLTSLIASTHAASVSDLVSIYTNSDGLLTFWNRARPMQSVGAEVELRREWSQGVMLSLSQSAVRVRQQDLIDGQAVANVPTWTTALRAAAPLVPGITGATRVRYESGRESDRAAPTEPTLLWDLTASGIVPAYGIDWALGVRNVLDWEGFVPASEDLTQDYLPVPGRTVYAELGMTF
jgi:outer membrane cobalamin receptor